MNVSIRGVLLLVSLVAIGALAEESDVRHLNLQRTVSESPKITDPKPVYFAEHFDDPALFERRWLKSQAKKDGVDGEIAKYDGVWSLESAQRDSLLGDTGLVLKSKAKHAAIAAPLLKPFVFNKKPLIAQYEVLLQDGQECGGAYIKLLSEGHKNPKNGTLEEKHCQKPKERLEETFSDKLPHLYTLILKPDNTFEISIDRKVVNSGSLLEDFVPPVNPAPEIDDPNDKKPEDWDESRRNGRHARGLARERTNPHTDPNAVKPQDWDTDMDGEWEPPLIENTACADAPGCGAWEPPLVNNPAFKGKWRPPMIDNPNYKGKWRPRKIQNPDYFEDKEPFRMTTVTAVGFELWSMSKDILFDNIIITDDLEVAERWAFETFDKKRQKIAQESNFEELRAFVQKLANVTNEYPFLWGVYIVVLAIPVVFLLYLCCRPSSSASQSQVNMIRKGGTCQAAAEKKKTDEATEDIQEEDEEEEKNEVEAEPGADEEDAEKNSEPDSEEDNEAVGDAPENKGSGEGARKRKVRKD
ncbi:hypothetical protein NQ317_003532 [Molorchus minor]|uniref:Calnexin n=1 Tax=Molorchus minor TaxID=1323400 RepID=A0ABQ9K3E6_9CUCU|nr:hypothetical protein NQ317_003532 [Molorchus minor]